MITDATKRKVLTLLNTGVLFDTQVAALCGVSKSTVRRIRCGDIVVPA